MRLISTTILKWNLQITKNQLNKNENMRTMQKKVNAYSKRSTLFTCFIIVLLLIFSPFFHKLFHSFGLCADIVRLFMCDAFIHVAVSILCWLLFRVVSMFFFLYFSWVHNFICKHRLNYMVEYITIAGCCCLTIITVSMLFYFSFFRFSSYYRVKKHTKTLAWFYLA